MEYTGRRNIIINGHYFISFEFKFEQEWNETHEDNFAEDCIQLIRDGFKVIDYTYDGRGFVKVIYEPRESSIMEL
jgi:hypothetical protein